MNNGGPGRTVMVSRDGAAVGNGPPGHHHDQRGTGRSVLRVADSTTVTMALTIDDIEASGKNEGREVVRTHIPSVGCWPRTAPHATRNTSTSSSSPRPEASTWTCSRTCRWSIDSKLSPLT